MRCRYCDYNGSLTCRSCKGKFCSQHLNSNGQCAFCKAAQEDKRAKLVTRKERQQVR